MSMPMSTARLARQAESIETRSDLDRWKVRSTTRLRFLLIAYLIGVFPLPAAALYFTLKSAFEGAVISPSAFISMSCAGLCCTGPIVLLPCLVLLNSGLSSYRKLTIELAYQQRVCELCQAVALFDDKYVNPSKRKGHTAADLLPQMYVVEEDAQTHVLCDKCFAQINAIEEG